jgi:hypothetical protein
VVEACDQSEFDRVRSDAEDTGIDVVAPADSGAAIRENVGIPRFIGSSPVHHLPLRRGAHEAAPAHGVTSKSTVTKAMRTASAGQSRIGHRKRPDPGGSNNRAGTCHSARGRVMTESIIAKD